MNFETVAPYLFYILGVLARVIIPYIQARVATEGPLSFDWRYLVGQLIAALVAAIPLVAGKEFMEQVGSLSWLATILYGWGAGDIGRTVQNVVKR